MSDTPRTDAASRMAFSGEYMVPIQDAQKLECELADMTKQRDALAEAGNQLLESLYSEDWRKVHAIRSMRKALAAVKGGSHE
jgi:hypothetical protein